MNFWQKYKKILIAAGFAAAVVILAWLLYALFFKQAATPRPPEISGQKTATGTHGGLTPAKPSEQTIPLAQIGGFPAETDRTAGQIANIASGGLTQTFELVKTQSLAATLSSNGSDLQYYDKRDGKFYRVTKDGQISPLSDAAFREVEKITWSPDKNKAILQYPDQAKIIYDFKNEKQISLPKHWKDFNFSPDGSKIVMKSMADDVNNRWIAIINSEGTSAQKIAELGNKDDTVHLAWSPNNQTVAMFTEGVNYDQQKVFFVGLNNENFKALTIEGRGFNPKWSPLGDRLLYSVYSSQSDLKPELWTAEAQGENIGSGRKKLNLQTWADKCAFSTDYEIYCAVPEKLEEGAGLLTELAKSAKDNLYKIDIRTGLKKLVAVPEGNFAMSDLIVSENGYYLYFTDANTERINKIKLK